MTERQPPREADTAASGPPAEPGPPGRVKPDRIKLVAPLPDDEAEGGDPVCWAHLVCEECGAITTEGHRAGCPAG